MMFVSATNMYLFDVFVAAYSKNSVSLQFQERIASVTGQGLIMSIYIGAVLEALGLSVLIGYIAAWIKKRADKPFKS
jgi:hypothetical protein